MKKPAQKINIVLHKKKPESQKNDIFRSLTISKKSNTYKKMQR